MFQVNSQLDLCLIVVENIRVGCVLVGWSPRMLYFFKALSGGIKLQEDGVNVGRPGTYWGIDSLTLDHSVTLPLPWLLVFITMS